MKKQNRWGMMSFFMLAVLWMGIFSSRGAERTTLARSIIEDTEPKAPSHVLAPDDLDNSSKLEVKLKTELDHKIMPLEIIQVEVFGEEKLSKEHRVQASGDITVFLLGNVKVAGKTTTQVQDELKELLGKDLLVDPQVIVTVKEYRDRYVNVMGEVVKPDAIPLKGEEKLTILEAIGRAGGFNRGASRRKIEFTRDGVTTRFSERDLNRMDKEESKKIYCEPGDTIYVRPSIW